MGEVFETSGDTLPTAYFRHLTWDGHDFAKLQGRDCVAESDGPGEEQGGACQHRDDLAGRHDEDRETTESGSRIRTTDFTPSHYSGQTA